MIAKMTAFYARIPDPLYRRVAKTATSKDLKLVAVLRQALELWLKENGG